MKCYSRKVGKDTDFTVVKSRKNSGLGYPSPLFFCAIDKIKKQAFVDGFNKSLLV